MLIQRDRRLGNVFLKSLLPKISHEEVNILPMFQSIWSWENKNPESGYMNSFILINTTQIITSFFFFHSISLLFYGQLNNSAPCLTVPQLDKTHYDFVVLVSCYGTLFPWEARSVIKRVTSKCLITHFIIFPLVINNGVGVYNYIAHLRVA